jgi:hypothetical protein
MTNLRITVKRIVPDHPTTTNREPDHATSSRYCEELERREVHVIPSGEVRIVPAAPTARVREPDEPTPKRVFEEPEYREVHVMSSGEVRIVLYDPTATNWEEELAILTMLDYEERPSLFFQSMRVNLPLITCWSKS